MLSEVLEFKLYAKTVALFLDPHLVMFNYIKLIVPNEQICVVWKKSKCNLCHGYSWWKLGLFWHSNSGSTQVGVNTYRYHYMSC